jgi:RNA polymerase sigma-70 factor (ECF subfamily)
MKDMAPTAVATRAGDRRGVELVALQDFDAIVQRHQRRIYRVMLGMVRDPDAAENLTQECFLRAYTNRTGFRGEASVGTWLVRIAINLAQDYGRNRRWGFWRKLSATHTDIAEVSNVLPDQNASAERDFLAREQLVSVWSATKALSPQQRAVFVLRFVEEMSLEEIAEATSLKLGTVKTHLFRAVRAIRRRLREQEER